MARTSPKKSGLRVAVTGAVGDLGTLLLPRLVADSRVERIVVLDVARPSGDKISFHKVDLVRPDAATEVAEILAEDPVDVVYHLAFLESPARHRNLAHELEVIGTMHVLAGVAQAKVPRLIVPSLTALYGARPQHPALLREDAPLLGSAQSRYLNDRIEVENQVRTFRERNPGTSVWVLRFAPVLGPRVDNLVTRFLGRRVVPRLLGFDPLWQAVHEDDAADALMLALDAEEPGEFNIVGRGVVPLSSLIRASGAIPAPVPKGVAHAALRAMLAAGAHPAPLSMLDYIHYSWVADGTRAEAALGFQPRHHVRDAAAALRRSV